MSIDWDHIDLPACWASALVNGDLSSLDEAEARLCVHEVRRLAHLGWRIVGTNNCEPRYTSQYRLYGGAAEAGHVLTYVIHSQTEEVTNDEL
jgi:hypothetical protein